MKLSREELETIIRCDANHEDWLVTTADPMFIRKLGKKGYEGTPYSDPFLTFRLPFKALTVRSKASLNRKAPHGCGFRRGKIQKEG